MIKFNGKVYFSEDELKCKSSGKLILLRGFEEKLLSLRLAYNKSMTLTSACRSTEHNSNVGGSLKSYHICDNNRGGTCAIDVYINNGIERLELTKLAIAQGWSVGIPSMGFIHLDMRTMLGEQQLIFGY